jgi:hypothetical protein
LLVVFDSVYLLAMASWVGSVAYFWFGVVPLISKVLGDEVGGLFSRCYVWGAVSGAVALPAFVAGPLCFPEYRGPAVGVQALALLGCTLLMLYGGNSLTPAIIEAQGLGPEGEERLVRLRRRSVALNGVVLLVGASLIVAFTARRPPVTLGIVEPTPEQRVRSDGEIQRVIEKFEAKYDEESHGRAKGGR